MQPPKALIALFLLSLVFIGCIKPVIITPTNEEKIYTTTNPASINITTAVKSDRNYKEIAYVFAQGKTINDAVKLAREEASKKGGEEIINGRVHAQVILSGFILFFPIYETYYYVRGTVIKYE